MAKPGNFSESNALRKSRSIIQKSTSAESFRSRTNFFTVCVHGKKIQFTLTVIITQIQTRTHRILVAGPKGARLL